MEFSRQEYWSGLPFPSPGDLPHLGIEPWSPTLWADTLPSEPPGKLNPKEQHSPGINMLLLSRSVFARGGKEYGWMWFVFFWLHCEASGRKPWHPTPVLLPGKPHGQRSLVGHSPWCPEESDTTEWLHFPFSLSCVGEGNGNPLQYSCLENRRDGGAWWAAIYGVA